MLTQRALFPSHSPGAAGQHTAPAAHVRWRFDEHERSELPQARLVPRGHAPRIAWGATPAHVRWPLDEHERSELPKARSDSGGTPPRTCAGDSMNTSEASCHKRDLSRAATRRELPGVQPPRSDSPGTGPQTYRKNFTFAPFLPLPFLHPSPADRRPSGPGCGAPPRASPHTSPAAPGFSAAAAGETSGYTP